MKVELMKSEEIYKESSKRPEPFGSIIAESSDCIFSSYSVSVNSCICFLLTVCLNHREFHFSEVCLLMLFVVFNYEVAPIVMILLTVFLYSSVMLTVLTVTFLE